MYACIFPGQGSQFPGMGKDIFEKYPEARSLFEKANNYIGYRITDVMFEGTEEELKATEITQPAVFLHSIILFRIQDRIQIDMVAGHSLGELTALVANEALTFEDGLQLVVKRAKAMQKACDAIPSTLAAIIGLEDKVIESVCKEFDDVVPANYNSPGQVVISGGVNAVEKACEKLNEAGARLTMPLNVAGAFHSHYMEPAQKTLQKAIEQTSFKQPICPIYQNVNAQPTTDPQIIKDNLIKQLTAPVLWTQTIQNMIKDGATKFTEVGPGNVLKGLVKKIDRSVDVSS